jgi:hypothetical protein
MTKATQRVWRAIGVATLLSAALLSPACSSSKVAAPAPDAAPATAPDAAPDVIKGSFAPDADPFATPPPDARPALPDNLVAGPPPEVSCAGATDVASACDLPPSSCALLRDCDAGGDYCAQFSAWIVYYEHPRCVDGRCVWDQSLFHCDSASVCRFGACASTASTS